MAKLSKIVMVRVTPELKSAIDNSANRLRLRPPDIVRYILAKALEELDSRVENNAHIKEVSNAT
jgi:hypothetical protein